MSKEYLTPDLLGSVYLYADSSVANTSFCYVVSLTMSVDRELLGRAVSDLMPRFPQFSLRVISGADSCSYAPMTSAVPVFPVGDRTRVSESGMFGHDCLFAVSVNHKTVCFDFHKSITDEKGVVPFIRAVIFRYLRLGGYEVENDGSVITADSEYHEIESDDAFVKLDDIPASRPIWYMDARAVEMDRPGISDGFRVTRIHLPLSKVRGEAVSCLSMPSTVVSPFFAQALLDRFPEKDVPGEFVVSHIQVNLRQYFPTTTFRPFFATLPLAYNRKLSDYPVATVLMSQKKFIEAQLRTDALAYNVQRSIAQFDRIMETSSSAGRISAVEKFFGDRAREATFSLCNIGSMIIPETMLKYITEFYPVVPPALYPYGIATINFKGDLVISVSTPAEDTETCRGFVSLLKKYEMPAYIAESFIHSQLRYKPEL